MLAFWGQHQYYCSSVIIQRIEETHLPQTGIFVGRGRFHFGVRI